MSDCAEHRHRLHRCGHACTYQSQLINKTHSSHSMQHVDYDRMHDCKRACRRA